ncbi:Predicted dithiol-disulfide isomerase, DsbA family [Micromonospora phaseoli]|uniref:Predicted dithiol-disulfide isomerase, DsbA family n=1 Tax=Micromonospora phaseoli TaxID=1144548 RepID=A0A1H7BCC1_9ACTN|nr:DsbA family oxidoreductase [Micromonospora phaseoli]PZV95042.1 putative DsbA family dithiol-disulfide isomerase [Micromonospora phaseoli]GIJ79533.1 disulfide isomerase [Micromonospora phaseoli]SEJ75343.1 Predicted dithiol-disulfide isomerase, DsbA family [Micromonospora phaseoli]
MEIDIYADVVCPWCWIGRRRLEQALASYDGKVTVRHRPFQLDPSPVTSPRLTLDALAGKFGGPERAKQMAAQVTDVGASVGLELNYERAISANTFDAHRLIEWAEQRGRGAEMVEALHRAHFTDGVDIGSRAALAETAAGVGLDGDDARRFLDSNEGVAELNSELAAARELGVTSVPTFVLAGKYAVTGAQEPATLLAALAEVEQREAAD